MSLATKGQPNLVNIDDCFILIANLYRCIKHGHVMSPFFSEHHGMVATSGESVQSGMDASIGESQLLIFIIKVIEAHHNYNTTTL